MKEEKPCLLERGDIVYHYSESRKLTFVGVVTRTEYNDPLIGSDPVWRVWMWYSEPEYGNAPKEREGWLEDTQLEKLGNVRDLGIEEDW